VAVAAVALLLGFVGGLASHAIFPPKQGASGAQGPVGQTGATGPAGSAASVDLSKIGLCVNVTTADSGVYYVSGVSIFAPTDNAGTLSCPFGQYVNLEPTLPNGQPSGYTP
jgi:hypothetical protein